MGRKELVLNRMTMFGFRKAFGMGRFATVVFTKKNGETRILNGKTKVNKDINGRGNYDASFHNQVRVFDVNLRRNGVRVGGWRTVSMDKIQEVRANGMRIVIE